MERVEREDLADRIDRVDLADRVDRVDRVERVERVERAERIDRLLLVDVLTEDLDVLTEDMPERVDEVDRSRLTRPMDRGVVERPRLTLRRACFTCLLLSRNSILILVKDDLAFFNSFFNFKS